MNAAARILVLSVSIACLCGCATSQSVAKVPAPEARPGDVQYALDAAYIAKVERSARSRGIVVQWVHPPVTRTVAD